MAVKNPTGDGSEKAIVTIQSLDLTNMVFVGWNALTNSIPVYPTLLPGGNYVIPNVGEQWVIVRYNLDWFLDSKIGFQDPRQHIPPEPGLTAYGGTGPTHVLGSEVHLPAQVHLGDWEMRLEPASGALQVRPSGSDGGWTTVTGSGGSGSVTSASITDATATGRALITAASAAAGRSTLAVPASANAKGFVNHGSNANVARPTGYASIEWYGTVAPLNATAVDTWVDTT